MMRVLQRLRSRVVAARQRGSAPAKWYDCPRPDPEVGYAIHPLDLAINKVHARAGRDEARDNLDVLHLDRHPLSLGVLCWAAVGQDPGYSPLGLVEQLARQGRVRTDDFADLDLTVPIDLTGWKTQWLTALGQARSLVQRLPLS